MRSRIDPMKKIAKTLRPQLLQGQTVIHCGSRLPVQAIECDIAQLGVRTWNTLCRQPKGGHPWPRNMIGASCRTSKCRDGLEVSKPARGRTQQSFSCVSARVSKGILVGLPGYVTVNGFFRGFNLPLSPGFLKVGIVAKPS